MKTQFIVRKAVYDAVVEEKLTRDWYHFFNTGEASDELLEVVMEVLMNFNEMPYGVAKARTGDPYQWTQEWLEENGL